MTRHVELRSAYADSVALLQVSRVVAGLPGVRAAQVAMGTSLNVEVLEGMGFTLPDGTGPNDLVVAILLDDAADAGALPAALAGVDEALAAQRTASTGSGAASVPHRTTATAAVEIPGAPVLVSVPGVSAVVEAVDALDAGRDVMLFSDNVPIEHEVALKRRAAAAGLLVMGPDCGTAVLGGVGLGFANLTRPGPVGLVAASGTGAQQVMALLDHAGVGVSQVLGVGGRDLSAEVGGLATTEACRRLDADPATERILVLSKPPASEVAARLDADLVALSTPASTALLGPGRPDLTEATEALLGDLGVPVPAWPVDGATRPGRAGRLLRGLYAGGTLAQEARLIAAAAGVEHDVVDLGDDAYTVGRAHPMIDPTLRLEMLAAAIDDPATGVLLLDVVLGHGAEADPAATVAPVLATATVPVVVCVVGTAADPQGRDRQVSTLVAAGAEVHLSNAGAARRAAVLIQEAP